MTLKLSQASTVTSGQSPNRGGSGLAALREGLCGSDGGVGASEPSFVCGASSLGARVDVLGPFRMSPFCCVSPLRTGVVTGSRDPGEEPPRGGRAIVAVHRSPSPSGGAIGRAQHDSLRQNEMQPGWRVVGKARRRDLRWQAWGQNDCAEQLRKHRGWQSVEVPGWRREQRESRDKRDPGSCCKQAPSGELLLACNWRRYKPGKDGKGGRFRERL